MVATGSEGTGGLVTFLFTDVVGSTSSWEAHPEEMARALARHDDIIERAVQREGGELVRPRGEGDSRFAVFRDPAAAMVAAVHLTSALDREPWPEATPIIVRCALHTGPAEHRSGDYYGSAVNRCARLRSIAHPGQVLASEATVTLGRSAIESELNVTDLGVHWLKDLTHPERVFQIDPIGASSAHPALQSRPPVHVEAAPVPAPVSSFVGRNEETEQVQAMVADPAVRIVTITGPGGVGKTRLAIEVASRTGPSLPGGACFVDLSTVTDPGLVAASIAAALGLSDQAGKSPVDALVDRFESADALLVLDNMEHVLAAAPMVGELSRRASSLTILATSRAPLRISGELEHPLPPLSLPDLAALGVPSLLETSGAVALFVARCRAHRPDFQLTQANGRSVAEICVRLDGLPLALELAAARIKLLNPESLLARLDQRLDFLVGGGRDAPSRQQTLRATLQWSYDLLDTRHQVLLARLSVFEGSFTLEAAEAVCRRDPASNDVLDLLAELIDSSLVGVSEASGGLRFELLQTVREFAGEHLAARGETTELQARQATHLLAATETAFSLLNGPTAPLVFADLGAEEANARAAFRHFLLHDPESAARLAIALRPFWVTQGRLTEGRRWVGSALDTQVPDPLRARLLVTAGTLACYQDAYGEAVDLLARGLELAETLHDEATIASATCFLGTATLATGDVTAATPLAERAHEISRRLGEYEPFVQSLSLLAMLAGISGDYETEARLHRARLERTRAHGDSSRTADTLNTLAEIALDDGDLRLARESAAEALALALGTSRLIVRDANLTLGRVALLEGDAAQAAASFADGLRLSVDFAQPYELALCLRGAAAVAAMAGDPPLAGRLAGVARNVRDPDGDVFPVEQDLETLLATARDQGPPEVFDAALAAGSLLPVASGVELAAATLEQLRTSDPLPGRTTAD